MSDLWLKTSRLVSEIERSIKDDLAHTVLHAHSITDIYVLAALHKQDKQRPMDLASAINSPATSFTPILDRLEATGLVTRTINKDDRRSILVCLTDEGKKLRRAVENAIGNAEVRYGGG